MSTTKIHEIVATRFPSLVATLGDLVAIPSVSGASAEPETIQQSADAVAAKFRELRLFPEVEILRSRRSDRPEELGNPAVVARREAAPGKPTVLLYAHHDVQPVGDTDLWNSEPFKATARGDRLYGRGAVDDKAGVVAHVGALAAVSEALGADFDLGVVVFIEGEEEAGSLSFANFLQDNRDLLRSDVIIVADSDNYSTETPALTISLRGIVSTTLRLRTLEHASHSGQFGGAAPDALMALVSLLASLYAPDGSLAIEGLQRASLNLPEITETQFRHDVAALPGTKLVGEGPIADRLGAGPSLTVIGIDAPSVRNASNTLLPEAAARLAMRVAPGQTPERAFDALKTHLEKHNRFGAELELVDTIFGPSYLAAVDSEAVATMREALRAGWGAEPVDMAIGGSIPFIADFVAQFPEAVVLVTGVEDPEAAAHSPNESVHLGVLRRAVLSEALFLASLNDHRRTEG